MNNLKNKTIFITGASRGIGREIALKCAQQGANIIIAAKSDTPHPKLSGTIHSVAEEVEQHGGKALAIKLDVRDQDQVVAAMAKASDRFGGIDALINNASAIQLNSLQNTDLKRFDLIHSVNTRGVFVCSQAAIPYLKKSSNPHIITLSPPINLADHWLEPHIPYTVTKYSMSLLALGLAQELRSDHIASNTLWPRTTIATSAVEFMIDEQLLKSSRTPAIMADAAYEILISDSKELTGQSFVDEVLLKDRGHKNFDQYKNSSGCEQLTIDLFLDE